MVTRNLMMPGWERQPWPPGSPITVDDDRQYMEQYDPEVTPVNACWSLDPEATA